MKKNYPITVRKRNCYFFIFALLFFFSKEANAQCAGTDSTVTVCDKEFDDSVQTYNLFDQLGGTPVLGGVWVANNIVDENALVDKTAGIVNLWDITVSGIHIFTYMNDDCNENATVTIELGPYAGENNIDLSANTCADNIEGNENNGDQTNLFNFLKNSISPDLKIDTNGTWVADGSNAIVGNANLNGYIFNAHDAGSGIYSFVYTVPAVSSCPEKEARLILQVNDPPEPGVPIDFVVCENDDLSIYQDLNLHDYLDFEEDGGFWIEESGTNQLTDVGTAIDTTINVLEIYNNPNLGVGEYSFTYVIPRDFVSCKDDSATVSISIVGINGEFLVDDYCDDGSLRIDILYENIFELSLIHDLEYEIHNTNTNELIFTGTSVGINPITPEFLSIAGITEHRYLSGLPEPFTDFYELNLNISPILEPGNYTITAKSVSNIEGLICDEFEIVSTTFNVFKPEFSVTETCFEPTDTVDVLITDYTDSNGNLSNETIALEYEASNSFNSTNPVIINETVTFVNGEATLPVDLIPFNFQANDIGVINLTFNNTSFSAINCINASFPYSILPDEIELSLSIDNACDASDVEILVNAPTLDNGMYTITYEVTEIGNTNVLLSGNSVIVGGQTSDELNISTLPAGNYQVILNSTQNDVNPCRSVFDFNLTEEFSIAGIPNTPVLASEQSFCFSDLEPNGPTLADIMVDSSNNLAWYADNVTTTALDATTLLTDGTTYFVSSNDPTNICDESPRAMVTVTIYQTSLVDISTTITQFCEIDAPTLGDINITTVNGGDLIWYANADITDTTELDLDTPLLNGISYFASERNGECEGERTPVVVSVIPNPLRVDSNTFCASPGDQIILLQNIASTDAGYELVWYESDQTTIITDLSTELAQNTTYYVSSLHTITNCESGLQPITVRITSPVLSNNTSPFFCIDDDATIAFLDANAQNGGTIIWYDELGNELSDINSIDLENNTSYFAVERVGTCESEPLEYTPIIIASPMPISTMVNPICIIEEENKEATVQDLEDLGIITTDSNFNLIWYDTLGNNINTNTLLEPGVVYFAASIHPASGCESERIAITVNVTAPVISADNTPVFCNTDTPTLANLDAEVNNQGTLTWYATSDTTEDPLPITTVLQNGLSYYATEKIGTCESEPLEFSVTVISPQTPTGINSVCASTGNTINDIASNFSTVAPAVLVWFDATNTIITPDAVLVNGTYQVASTVENSDCVSDALVFTVTLTTTPEASNTTFSFCGKDNATLNTLNNEITNFPNKGSLVWYTDAVGGTPLTDITTPLVTNTYYVADVMGSCESERLPFNITVTSPETPVYNGDNPVCAAQNTTLLDLESNITFNNTFELVWYDLPENGTEIVNTTLLTNGTYYPATIDRASGCESERLEIIVNIISIATTTNMTQVFCSSDNATLNDLDVTAPNGGDLIWFDSITGGNVLENDTQLTNNTNYFVIEQNGTCGSITRLQIAVSIVTPPTPLFEGETALCALSEPTILTLEEQITFDDTVYEIIWYDAEENGIELATSDLLEEGVSYYTRLRDIATSCEGEATEISVTLSNCDPEEFNFFIPDGFSPNGDSRNDTYFIPNIQYFYPEYDFEIFNRYGQSMFKGDINNSSWDGTNNGSQVETTTGVYFYIINYNDDDTKPVQGRLYLSK